ncbi:MAG: phage holin family protein [Patescibacteria group bacterium]|nr:phage holin family protein [Patescibacteria group bacterium]
MQTIIQIISNALAVSISAYLLPGLDFSGSWWQLMLAGAILGIINTFIKPILKLIFSPFILITLGLFTVVINTSLLILVALIVPGLSISGFWPAFWGVIIISLTNYAINTIIGYKEE